jgi:hypothetical protein
MIDRSRPTSKQTIGERFNYYNFFFLSRNQFCSNLYMTSTGFLSYDQRKSNEIYLLRETKYSYSVNDHITMNL